jgi:hypothetical protein
MKNTNYIYGDLQAAIDLGSVIFSGGTDLYSIFSKLGSGINGSGTDNVVPLWNGTNILDDSILSQAGTVMTATGDIIITGDFTVNGTTTTINTQTLQAADNNIELNLSGNSTTATGGGIIILSGVSNSINSTWSIDASGNWQGNAGILGKTVTAAEFFAMEPYTGVVATASDNDVWFHSGVTGIITLNYKAEGVEYSVELA